jgi:hypothetical protein
MKYFKLGVWVRRPSIGDQIQIAEYFSEIKNAGGRLRSPVVRKYLYQIIKILTNIQRPWFLHIFLLTGILDLAGMLRKKKDGLPLDEQVNELNKVIDYLTPRTGLTEKEIKFSYDESNFNRLIQAVEMKELQDSITRMNEAHAAADYQGKKGFYKEQIERMKRLRTKLNIQHRPKKENDNVVAIDFNKTRYV